MIRRLKLLRNIGQFDSVDTAASIDLTRLVMVYGENGRGKTTFVAVLRSLKSGNSVAITERRRLSSTHSPHVVLKCDGDPEIVVFENGAWNRTIPDLVVFDDLFVDENVHSGLEVEAGHRQKLHELVLGAQGVTLSRRIQELVRQVEEHNRTLREKSRAIPERDRHGLSVDEFCALGARPNIEAEMQESERALAAARAQDPVRRTPMFGALSLPGFEVDAIEQILGEDLPSLDTATAERVHQHIDMLGAGGEQWLSDGMHRLRPGASGQEEVCPFCAQDLGGSSLIKHYRAYFSEAYRDLKNRIEDAVSRLDQVHGGDVPAGFERAVRLAVERRQFWSQFCNVPEIEIDTAEIVRDWRTARDVVGEALRRKQAAPLEAMALDEPARAALSAFERHRARVSALSDSLLAANEAIGVVKEQAAGSDPHAIEANLARLQATRARHTPEIAALCDKYLAEKVAKERTEAERDQARAELDEYRTNVFPQYETSVNLYLQRFTAGFRLSSVTSVSTRGGPACTYNVLINNTPVQVGGGAPTPGEPSFRNILSAGDRNTLALAFFFASLDQDPQLGNRIVVIDDPISSLDEHRALTTVQQVRGLAERAKQVVVLSHDKRFLCRVWSGADPTVRSALEIVRAAEGSKIRQWNVERDSMTEHDRRHSMFRKFLQTGSGDHRDIAKAIRPHLEAYLRVACPEHFPPGSVLGPFVAQCRQRIGQANEILDDAATRELEELKEYANRFHHDTNPAWETEVINDGELRGFVERTLAFATR